MLDVGKPQKYNAYDAPHADLREFLARGRVTPSLYEATKKPG